jgi:nucleoside 2-deoxyribosyltransferase
MRRIYLAGFEVFKADSVAHGTSLKSLCRRYGYQGLYPLDNVTPAELGGRALADWIYRANIELIRQSDLVMANLNVFRGHEPDSGTAFEVGYAVALGKPVWAYTGQSQTLVERIAVATDPGDPQRAVDADGYTVEDFGLNLNLMLACSATMVVGDAEACLARIQAHDAGETPDGRKG